MRIIEVTVSVTGQSTVHTTGFAVRRLPPSQPVPGNRSGPASARTTDQRIPSNDQQSRAPRAATLVGTFCSVLFSPFVRLLSWLLPLKNTAATLRTNRSGIDRLDAVDAHLQNFCGLWKVSTTSAFYDASADCCVMSIRKRLIYRRLAARESIPFRGTIVARHCGAA